MFCPICKSEKEAAQPCKAHLGGDADFDLLECAQCGVRYISPVPTSEDLAILYSGDYYGTDWYKQQGYGMAFAKSVLRHLPAGKFLDVGCGLGYFLDGVRKNCNWDVRGVELGETAAAYARQNLDLDVRSDGLKDFESDYFDYIQIKNVLEHVTDPVGLLEDCYRVIKKGGRLHLFVPNGPIDSADLLKFYAVTGEPGFSKSGHLFFFSPKSLLLMFEQTGFEITRSRTYGIRRGLAVLGLWPRFKNWTRFYSVDRKSHKPLQTNKIALPPKKERPGAYYRYRNFRMNAKMLKGLRPYGLDFELILRPVIKD
ncbi:MAG: class I SAM-dependent methyltransferase [Pyrinomonadaceae bacterium]